MRNLLKALEKNKIAFVGPNRKAIVSMGDKIESKKIAEEASVNVIPGYTKAIKDEKEAVRNCKRNRLSSDAESKCWWWRQRNESSE